jgi:hypothetical protein
MSDEPKWPTKTCAECGAPIALWCHACHKPLCWQHIVTRMLVAHCAACWTKEYGPIGKEQTNNGL